MRNLLPLLALGLLTTTLGCAGCDSSGVNGNNSGSNAGFGADNVYTDTTGAQCSDPTPCGDCDQDCRPGGNPFVPGASGGDNGFDGETCTTDADCKGTCGPAAVCTGFGSSGTSGTACTTDADCRGICDGTNTCE